MLVAEGPFSSPYRRLSVKAGSCFVGLNMVFGCGTSTSISLEMYFFLGSFALFFDWVSQVFAIPVFFPGLFVIICAIFQLSDVYYPVLNSL